MQQLSSVSHWLIGNIEIDTLTYMTIFKVANLNSCDIPFNKMTNVSRT